MTAQLPIPDFELADRVSPLDDKSDPLGFYLEAGRQICDEIEGLLPADWSWADRRVLDFGCGAGRIVRHLVGSEAELHGCDIDAPSIDWMRRNMDSQVSAFTVDEAPGIDRPDDFFDLVYAVSVFTHVTTHWAGWLLELRRVLKPDGLLVATFIAEGVAPAIAQEPWNEDRIGMNVLNEHQPWELGGPTVLHSPWWIREHWGRAFEIVDLRPHGFANDPGAGHGVIVGRPRPGPLTVDELEAIDASDPREVAALRHNIEQLHRQNESKRYALAELQASPSWRVTAPLRAAKRALVSRTGGAPRHHAAPR